MTDGFLTRDWADNHNVMSDGIDKLVKSIGKGLKTLASSMKTLNRLQFDAPWKHERRQPGGARCG